MKRNLLFSMLSGLVMTAVPAGATIVVITAVDLPGCDVLYVPSVPLAEEFGNPDTFPEGEWINHMSSPSSQTVCDTPLIDPVNGVIDNPLISNRRITIENLQTFDIPDLFYVVGGASNQIPAGTFSNYDGMVNGAFAMQIDRIGVNRPLVFESLDQDQIFQAGEIWQFVVQDYVGQGTGGAFFSPGIVGNDTLPSIIVPEPAGIALSVLGGLLVLRRRR